MGFFRKKADPITDRSRALKAEIEALEAQIKDLDSKLQSTRSHPRLRSTALPHGQSSPNALAAERGTDPIFEQLDGRKLNPEIEPEPAGEHQNGNELGVRKSKQSGPLWKRMQNHFRGPVANNPKLVSYLAAGSIKGLRPLRYEKRVARNRFIALLLFLLLVLWGIFFFFFGP